MALHKYLLPVYLLSSAIFFSCSDSESNEQTSTDETIQTEITSTTTTTLSENLKKIVKTENGVFRGIEFYTPMSEVKKQEDTTQVVEIDEEEDYINYTVNLNPVESVDILYYFDKEQKVVKMEANLYPKSEESQNQLYEEFTSYFTTKYGTPINEKGNQLMWKENSTIVVMTKTGNEKVHDLKIEFQPSGTDAVSTL